MGNVATPLATAGRTMNPVPQAKPTGRILVVEDDPAVQKALRRLFETEGYAVETQSDGKSAIESFQSSAPAAIVLTCACRKFPGATSAKKSKRKLRPCRSSCSARRAMSPTRFCCLSWGRMTT